MQADSEDEEEVFESSKEEVEASCVDAREKLTNSIRLKWRKLKSHMERLDSQGSWPQGTAWYSFNINNTQLVPIMCA